MKRVSWEVKFGVALLVISLALNFIHYVFFKDLRHILLWSLTDLAFLPISVLFVALFIDRMMFNREKRARLEKLNMLIGAFFSEVGMRLAAYLSQYDPHLERICKELVVKNDWSEQEFFRVSKRLKGYDYGVDIKKIDLVYLRSFLIEKRDFLLRLLENPNLMEHESFTALLRAVFHLTEELESRKSLKDSPDSDLHHMSGDIKRVYTAIVAEWADYMKHLKNNYPYLFSLAMRINPFDKNASVIVK